MIVQQIGEARDYYHANTLWLAVIPELHDFVCQMAHSGQLDAVPYEGLLKKKKRSGAIVVTSGDYPSLTPEQLQELKVTRSHNLSVSTCVVRSNSAKGGTLLDRCTGKLGDCRILGTKNSHL